MKITSKDNLMIRQTLASAALIIPIIAATIPSTVHADTATATASTEVAVANRVVIKKKGSEFVQSFDDKLTSCLGEFAAKAAPRLNGTKGAKLAQTTYPLCFNGFGTLYSGVSRTPFWSASHLTDTRIREARALARTDNFHTELRLPAEHRSELADYRRSGFDRGHVAPNGDMATLEQQYDSFSLANIAPQNHEHNRNIWRHIEIASRNLTLRHREIYVVTGVAFNTPSVERIGGRVMVPSHFYKAIYIPSLSAAGVYYSPNNTNNQFEVISLTELKRRTGIDAMPALPASIQDKAYRLPNPNREAKQEQSVTLPTMDFSKEGWLTLAVDVFRYLIEYINKA